MAATTKRGALIVFEGVDRCGKTTQAKKLVEALVASGQKAEFMRFPDRETTIGSMINKYLTGTEELDDRCIHLLFSANRWEKRKHMLELLKSGTHLVVDRYAQSGVAFSSSKPHMDIEWCKHPDAGLAMPDAIFYMELDAAEAAKRGGWGGERYENAPFQQRVRERFAELRASAKEKWHVIDAAGSIEDIHNNIFTLAKGVITEAEGTTLRKLWDGAPLE